MTTRALITGLGVVIADMKDVDATEFAVSAIELAARDARVPVTAIDGLLVSGNELIADDHLSLDVARRGPFGQLRVLYELESKGTTMSLAVEHAARLVEERRADHVVVVFADAAIAPGKPSGAAFAGMGGDRGLRGLERANGMLGAVAAYAMIAGHYLNETGSSEDDLFAVAAAQREWAAMNSLARSRTPLTWAEYQDSPLVAAPLRRLDCARPVSGAVAILMSSEVQSDAPPPIAVLGSAQRYAMRRRHVPHSPWRPLGARDAFDDALGRGGRGRTDLDFLQIYDPFTVVPLILLEELGFVDAGKAGTFIAEGNTRLGGRLPVNTGGGQISGFYLQGATPLIEAITQLRGMAGPRQIESAETGMVVAIGGRLEAHASLLLGRPS